MCVVFFFFPLLPESPTLLQFNYLTAPATNHLNVNLVHHQQVKTPFVSHPPYSEHYCYESSNNIGAYNSSTPNSTIRSVKNYRKPHPPTGVVSMNANYNVMNMNTSTTTNASSYSATNPLTMTNNLNNISSKSLKNNHSYKFNNNNNNNHSTSNVSQSNNNNSNISYHSAKHQGYDANTNLSRRSSQQSTTSSHEWMTAEKPHSLSLCINRINLKKSNKSSSNSSSSSSGGAQFQSMRCRKHRNRNHFFNTSSSTAYQRYKLTKSCSNDTVNSSEQPSDFVENQPQTTYKFI